MGETLFQSISSAVLIPLSLNWAPATRLLKTTDVLWSCDRSTWTPRWELWPCAPAAFNVCGIAYQRSIRYQSADRTPVWRTLPTQLKTFRAYYPSLTLQLAQLKMIHPGLTQWHVTFFLYAPVFSHLQVWIILMLMVRFFCCLHQALRGEKSCLLKLIITQKVVCLDACFLIKANKRQILLFLEKKTSRTYGSMTSANFLKSLQEVNSQKFLTLCCSLYFQTFLCHMSTNVIPLKRLVIEEQPITRLQVALWIKSTAALA